ncbi:MAG: TIM barrel protein [Acidobacteriota bacterium]
MGKMTLAALPAMALVSPWQAARLRAQSAKPSSRFAGVTVGLNVPYSFRNQLPGTSDDILRICADIGVSAVELRLQPIENHLGSPAPYPQGTARAGGAGAGAGGGNRGAAGGGGRGAPAPPTPEQIAADKAAADDLRRWRLALPMARVEQLKKQYDDAGVTIDVVKIDPFDSIWTLSEDEISYFFAVGKALGARGLSCELLDYSMVATKLLGSYAEAHRLPVAYHGHGQSAADFRRAMAYSKYNWANIDLGHYVAANGISPLPFITEIHDRITHVHVKDRKMHNGPNMPFGQGDTPIKAVLQAIRDKKWPIAAVIEYEYPVPEGSTVLAELKRSVAYCRDCLVG